MIRIACVVAALLVASPAPALAQLRTLSDGATPVLFADRVLWGQRSGEIMHFVAAAGAVGVASTDGALIVFDLRSGTELHQVSLEGYDAQVTSLAVSEAGDVAATTAVGDGSDVLLYAPAGVSRVRALAREV